ncbi:ParA family protein [Pseudorhodobacter sp.]|uniref:ParA family protein n=1 Tax=Pseudorhodobacter sp. TaxID=1934400 RepID=UPI00264A1150|nr:ParA family protein [Pseudorhodobacter sp.]MDN5787461.1 ParA family protein [Pseudorhodobacter sp.]
MLTITLMNQKGGAGKSTVARALLSAGDSNGLRCAFIDADQTGNLARWAMRAAEGGLWSDAIDAYQTIDAEEVAEIVDEIATENNIDLLVIDTAGDASRDHDVFAVVADLILCPIMLSRSDIETARGTANFLYRMKDRAEDPSQMPAFRIMLNRVASRPSKGDREIIDALQATKLVGPNENTGLEVMQILGAVLQEREAYKTMDREGLLGHVLARHNETAPGFAKHPKHLTNAITEADKLLAACFAVAGGGHDDR